jgi:hypothetical protein
VGTVAEEPQGDNVLAEAKRVMGDRVCLLGNLDQLRSSKARRPSVRSRRKTRDIVRVGKPGGRISVRASSFLEEGPPPAITSKAMLRAAEDGAYIDNATSDESPNFPARLAPSLRAALRFFPPRAHPSAARWPFFAFDNGVGRGKWTPEKNRPLRSRPLGYDGESATIFDQQQ